MDDEPRHRLREITIEYMTTEWAEEVAGVEGPMPERVKEGLAKFVDRWKFAGEVPVVRSLKADWEGRLWVERTGEEITPEGLAGGPIDIVSPEGDYVGTYPAGSLPMPAGVPGDGLAGRNLGCRQAPVRRRSAEGLRRPTTFYATCRRQRHLQPLAQHGVCVRTHLAVIVTSSLAARGWSVLLSQ